MRETKEEAGLTIRPGEMIAERIHRKMNRLMYYMAETPVHGTSVFVGDGQEPFPWRAGKRLTRGLRPGPSRAQIQLLNHILDSQELYGITWPASSG